LEKEVIGYLVDGKIVDTQTIDEVKKEAKEIKEIFFDNSKEALEIIRHSAAHLLAQAISNLYKKP